MLWGLFIGVFMGLMIWCGIGRAVTFSETKWERASADWIRKWHNNKPFSPADYRKEELEIAAGVTDHKTTAPIEVQYEWLDWQWVVLNGTTPPATTHRPKFNSDGTPTGPLLTMTIVF